MSRLVYLAVPSDQAQPGPCWWKSEVVRISGDLSDAGNDVYRPTFAFKAGGFGAGIQSVNRAALAAADGGVALVPAGVPTLGVPAEIEQMLGAGRPVLVVTDLERSVQLRDWEGRGAVVVYKSEEGIAHGLLRLQHLMAELKPDWQTFIFERSGESGWADSSSTPDTFPLLPSRGYAGDAGLDLVVSEDTKIDPWQFADVPCGVRADIPAGHFGLILGRSSTLRKRGLMVNPGVIDEGWTGPLFAGAFNMRREQCKVKSGERIAQLIVLPAPGARLTPVWGIVPAKERGTHGFGSTGV